MLWIFVKGKGGTGKEIDFTHKINPPPRNVTCQDVKRRKGVAAAEREAFRAAGDGV